jgi:uncharacterized DUF497 family protein
MEIIFDAVKNEKNITVRGISLSEASKLDWDSALVWTDDRALYGEQREVALALMDQRVYCVVFVDRGDTRRIISLRKANLREVKRYDNEA